MTLKQYLIAKGFLNTEIENLINNEKISINQKKIKDFNYELKSTDKVLIDPQKTWVSRGAYKLLAAIEAFKLNFKNKIVLDIGASTGGFTQVSLFFEAKKVYALDVGTNQLDYQLRINPQVKVYEKTNFKHLTPELFKEKIDIVVCDVSFISLKYLFTSIQVIKHNNLILICLIKPQFEAKKELVDHGFVDEKYHPNILNQIHKVAQESGFKMINIIKSPIKGQKANNTEYIAYYQAI